MSQPKTMTEWIRLVATPQDKALLEAIRYDNGDEGFSTTVRRLIREEARRRGLVVVVDSVPAGQLAVQAEAVQP